MMLLPLALQNKWKDVFHKHQYLVNSENIYFNTIRLVNKHHKLLDREGFVEYYKNILDDIELESHPIDMFIPNDKMDEELERQDGEVPQIIVVSHETPEFKRIEKRINLEDLYATIPETHPVHMELKANPGKLPIVIDDIVLYWGMYKFLDMIEAIRLRDISTMTPVIEYVVDHITLDMWNEYLSSKRINESKVTKWMTDNFFGPDMEHTISYYEDEEKLGYKIDITDLLKRMCTNIIFDCDIYIIIAVYLILSFAKVDISEGNYDGSPCAKYVRDVISKL